MALTKKQKAVYNFILEYHRQNNYSPSQEEIRRYFNLRSLGSVQRYIHYLTERGLLKHKMNETRGLIPQDLEVYSDHQEKNNPFESLNIPILGNIAAGTPILAYENIDDHLQMPLIFFKQKHKNRNIFALKIKGESMIEKGILDGDIVFIAQQSWAQKGDIIAAYIDGQATLKQYIPEDKRIRLKCYNSQMKDLYIYLSQHREFLILGIYLGLIRLN